MKHTCRTCDGTKLTEDGKPCPDCMLEVLKTIKNCMQCKWSTPSFEAGAVCMFHNVPITADTPVCNIYKPKIN